MTPGPITSQSFPPEFGEEFRVVTIDLKTRKEIEPVYEGTSEAKALKAWDHTVKALELARDTEGGSYEPTAVRIVFGSGETQEQEVA